MNATVKNISHRHLLSWKLSFPLLKFSEATRKQYWIMIGLIGVVFLSAFSVICVADINRRAVETEQALLNQTEQLHNQWSELLSQESTINSQGMITRLAQDKLNMQMPNAKNITVIQQSLN
jgi:cell division protein FtsL